MNNNILIRNQFTNGDIGNIISLHSEIYSKEYKYDYTFEAYVGEEISKFAKRNNDKESIWIVEQNKEVVGSIAICQYNHSEAQLRWFILSPTLRGKGIGIKLIDLALKFVKNKSYKTVHLWTVDGLEKAKNIYLNEGFILVEEIKHKIWGSNHTEQKYIKELN